MDWRKEAQAVMDDVRSFVSSIQISDQHESNEMMIFFEIRTLENQTLVVCMNSHGFTICDETQEHPNDNMSFSSEEDSPEDAESERPTKSYETIYALLDKTSEEYRKRFMGALLKRIDSRLSDRYG